jgi:hypothetical protein
MKRPILAACGLSLLSLLAACGDSSDSGGSSGSADPPPAPPAPSALSVSAGPDAMVASSSIPLAASVTGGSGTVTFTWSVVGAPAGFTAAIAATGDPTTTARVAVGGTYIFRATAADAGGPLADEVAITVTATGSLSISGSVEDGGTAASGIAIELQDLDGARLGTTTTSAAGAWQFAALLGDPESFAIATGANP